MTADSDNPPAPQPAASAAPSRFSGVNRVLGTVGRTVGGAFRRVGGWTRRFLSSAYPWLVAASILLVGYIFWTPIKNMYWSLFPPLGAIYVDSPEVYTRERLINERLNEEAWLDKQLAAAAINDDFTSVENIIRRQLNLSLDAEGDNPPGAATTEVDTTSTEQPSLLDFNDKFRLRSASRSLIRQRIIENKLDDRHDLEGNALYVLKFDNTVVSAPASGRMAQIKMAILPPRGVEDAARYTRVAQFTPEFLQAIRGGAGHRLEETYEDWIEDIHLRINRRLSALYSSFILDELTHAEVVEIRNYIELNRGTRAERSDPAVAQPNYMKTMDSLLGDTGDEKALYAIKSFFARQAIAEVLGVEEDEIAVDVDSPLTAYGQIPVSSDSLPDAATMTVQVTAERPRRPTVQVSSRRVQMYALDEECVTRSGFGLDPQQNVFQAGVARLTEDGEQTSVPVYQIGTDPLIISSNDLEIIIRDIINQHKATARVADSGWQLYDFSGLKNDPVFGTATNCKIYYGINLRIGYYHFVRSVMVYNTYSYSVLPRESSLPILNDISNRYDYSGPGDTISALLGTRTRSHELRAFLTTFGDVVRRIGDDATLPDNDTARDFDPRFAPIVGWIIDPGAKSPTSRETGEFVTMNESVLAIISVPAWWSEIRLAIQKEWIEGDGDVVPAVASTQTDEDSRRELTVRLPNRSELIDALLVDSARSGPAISEIDTRVEQTCDEIPLLIVGQRLWRNTAVTVGSIKARRIEVMPNMGGVIAYFARPFSAGRNDSLRLWTSEGVAEAKLNKEISDLPPNSCPQPQEQ